jgi:excinuclease ABC subunit C
MDLQRLLSKQMEAYSQSLEYEKAAVIRDRLKAVNSIQQQSSKKVQDCDVIGLASMQGLHCLVVFSYRGGQNYGSKVYFPSCQMESESQDILAEFIMQFYRSVSPPPVLLLPIPLAEVAKNAISMLYKMQLKVNSADELVQNANANALMYLENKAQKSTQNKQMLCELGSLFDMSKAPERVEVYDNSHIMGKYPTGAVVVATCEGIIKSECRAYKLEPSKLHGGDDYAMLKEVLRRRFRKGAQLPDLIIIDGGKGHLSAALEALEGTNAFVVAMAKGKERNAGKETFFLKDKEPINLPSDNKLMHYLQRIRDEVHELAINSYRKKHMKSFKSSIFDSISGVGDARKRALLGHFGSIDGIKKASLEQLEQVPGVGKKFAQKLHSSLRAEI